MIKISALALRAVKMSSSSPLYVTTYLVTIDVGIGIRIFIYATFSILSSNTIYKYCGLTTLRVIINYPYFSDLMSQLNGFEKRPQTLEEKTLTPFQDPIYHPRSPLLPQTFRHHI